MKLYLLAPRNDLSPSDNPWAPWYDKAFGFVIRAKNEAAARQSAATKAGNESLNCEVSPWLSDKYSTCELLSTKGEAGIILRDFNAA